MESWQEQDLRHVPNEKLGNEMCRKSLRKTIVRFEKTIHIPGDRNLYKSGMISILNDIQQEV
jgi:hypothetical protein